MKVKKELVTKGETNPLKREENMKKLRHVIWGFRVKKSDLSDLELIKTEPPRYKKIQLERFCGDPVAFYIYKRKNLFLEEKLQVKNDEAIMQRRKKAMLKEEQRREREKKEADEKARLVEVLNKLQGAATFSESRVGSPKSMSGVMSMDGWSTALSHFGKKKRHETAFSYHSNPMTL